MPYATQQNMIDRFAEEELVQLTDRANTGVIDAAVLALALADADVEIDGYLVGRYKLPLGTTPPILTQLACDIARYRLYDDHATDHVRKRYEDARGLLQSISKGQVQLGLPVNGGAAAVAGTPEVSAPTRIFTNETLKDF